MRVVITRAENEAVRMAASVERIGCTPLVASMLDIVFTDAPIKVDGVQGILVTSRNGLRALENATDRRDLKIFCVGPQTKKFAEELGFTDVRATNGGAKNLPVFLRREATPGKGPILFLHGGNVAGNPIQEIQRAGFRVFGHKAYYAGAVDHLPDDVRAEFEKDVPPEVVTIMSIRTFKMFRAVMEKEGLLGKLRDTQAVCISPAVADFVREVRWKKVHIASDMTGNAILDKVSEIKESVAAAS